MADTSGGDKPGPCSLASCSNICNSSSSRSHAPFSPHHLAGKDATPPLPRLLHPLLGMHLGGHPQERSSSEGTGRALQAGAEAGGGAGTPCWQMLSEPRWDMGLAHVWHPVPGGVVGAFFRESHAQPPALCWGGCGGAGTHRCDTGGVGTVMLRKSVWHLVLHWGVVQKVTSSASCSLLEWWLEFLWCRDPHMWHRLGTVILCKSMLHPVLGGFFGVLLRESYPLPPDLYWGGG